jgi:hypothetical protein
MMTCIYFPVVPSACMYMSVRQLPPFRLPGLPEDAREVVRAGRRAARGGRRPGGKGAGKRRADGAERARKRTAQVPVAVRDEMREPPGKLARKFPDSRRNGVDSCQKGELASLLYPEYRGEIHRAN